MFKLLFDVHQCSPVFFLLNIVYFSVCLTSNKLYWIDDQLADISTRFYTSASWRRRVGVGELVRRRVDWLPLRSHFEFLFTIETNRNKITRYIFVQLPTFPEESRMSLLNSLPSSTRNSLLGCRMPHLKAMDLAVFTLSPVTMRTTIPARWHFKIASGT